MIAQTESVSRFWIGLKILAILALLALFNFSPGRIGLINIVSAHGVSPVTLSDLGLRLPIALMNLWWLLAIALNLVLLRCGCWTQTTRWLKLCLGLFGAAILVAVLTDADRAFENGIPLPALGNRGLRVLLGRITTVVLAVAIFLSLLTTAKRLYRLLGGLPSAVKRWLEPERSSGRPLGPRPIQFWGDFERTLRRDLKEVYYFYLDDEARRRLAAMSPIGKSVRLVVWLVKSMFRKLTPARRVLLVVALLTPGLSVQLGDASVQVGKLGFFVLFLILLLELKDKLLALDELAVGRAVQMALLPSQNPRVQGWDIWLYTRPANEVGGDLVDHLQLGEDRWGIALGDVAGKGLGAALLMAKVQATLRALAPSFDSLSRFGSEMNHIICRDGLRNRFASLVYIELRPGSGNLRLLNAGHFPPLVLREHTVEELPRGGAALGITPDASYTEERLELRSGELLLVYSDGLTEAMNPRGDFFGRERLLGILPSLRALNSEAAGERLLAEVKAFVGEGPASDDLSLAVLRRLS